MKTIIPDHTTSKKLVTVSKVLSDYPCGDYVIAYSTPSNRGVAVLVNLGGHYGFVYHTQLIRGCKNDAKFVGCDKREALENALKANRAVVMLDNFTEFTKYAAQFSEY